MRYERDPNLIRKILGRKVQFIMGDTACVYGSILAGCSFFAGYPITPASEIAEEMSKLLPRVGGVCIQMEDEIASIAAVIGASWAGAKAMTATSGPGFSLMMENYGYAVMSETPCVIVNVQRVGPSTGQPTRGAQGDMMQARWGTHGDIEAIALAPSSAQECLDLTIEAFNLAERYRHPVCVMADGEIGHLREKVVIPDEEEIEIVNRTLPEDENFLPFDVSKKTVRKVPEFPVFGKGFRVHVTGLTHNSKGLPATDSQEEHEKLVKRIVSKISDDRDKLTMVEKVHLEDAEIAIIAYGASARPAEAAVEKARAEGKKVGLLRLKLVWPFPINEIEKLSQQVEKIFVPEMNLGQIIHPVREYARGNCEVVSIPKIGGEMHTVEEIYKYIKGEYAGDKC